MFASSYLSPGQIVVTTPGRLYLGVAPGADDLPVALDGDFVTAYWQGIEVVAAICTYLDGTAEATVVRHLHGGVAGSGGNGTVDATGGALGIGPASDAQTQCGTQCCTLDHFVFDHRLSLQRKSLAESEGEQELNAK